MTWAIGILLLAAPAPDVRVDPDVELFSILFRLAGAPEYNHVSSFSPYGKAVKEHFAAHADHPAVRHARALRASRGIAYDAVMSLAVHAREDLSKRPPHLEKRWTVGEARAFRALVREFRAVSGFDEFWKKHEAFYGKVAANFRETARKNAHLDWFDRFFGEQAKGRTVVYLGLLNGTMNYGVRNSTALTPVLGMYRWNDETGLPEPAPQFVPLLVHEIAHSYVNPLVDMHFESCADAAQALFFSRYDQFRKQAYPSGRIVAYESVVRAVVHRHLRANGRKADSDRQMVADRLNGFAWTPELVALLDRYEGKDGARFADFMPEVAAFFRVQAKRVDTLPRLLRVEPKGVLDPSARELRFVFDRKMQGGSWSMLLDGDHPFPKIDGRIRYQDGRTTLVVPVRLAPSTTYRFWMNSANKLGFMSDEGIPLAPVRIALTTGPAAE